MKAALTPELLLAAYANGYFPMARSRRGKSIDWYLPEARGILPLDAFHIPRSLTKFMRAHPLRITVNTAFSDVIAACAERPETWINDEIIRLYTELHRLGFAHSIECWKHPHPAPLPHAGEGRGGAADEGEGNGVQLVGGLYGIAIGGGFFAESMFSSAPNASKYALIHLVELLRKSGYALLDTQYTNEHIRQFGVVEISNEDYQEKLKAALRITPTQYWKS